MDNVNRKLVSDEYKHTSHRIADVKPSYTNPCKVVLEKDARKNIYGTDQWTY